MKKIVILFSMFIMYWGGLAFHIYSTYIIYRTTNLIWAILGFIVPPIQELILLGANFAKSGINNIYVILFIIWSIFSCIVIYSNKEVEA